MGAQTNARAGWAEPLLFRSKQVVIFAVNGVPGNTAPKDVSLMVPIAEPDAVRRQLERILASEGFCRNERLARFLRFVVEQHLEGRDSEIKESVIAIEVFGRGADHDPRQDSIVRTEAARLRARLGEYQLGAG